MMVHAAALAVLAALSSIQDVNAFVPATQGRAKLISRGAGLPSTSTSESARYASTPTARGDVSMDLSSLESKLLDVPGAKTSGFTLPSVNVKVPDVKVPDVKIPGVKIPDMAPPDVSLPSVELPDVTLPDIDLDIPPEIQSQIKSVVDNISPQIQSQFQSLVDTLSPQIQSLLNYVGAELQMYWSAYVAKLLVEKDSATIIGTGWSGLIVVLIAANTVARSGSAEQRKEKFEEEKAAKEAAELKKAKGSFGGLKAPKVTLQEVTDVSKRIAAGRTVAVSKLNKKKPAAAVASRTKTPVVNPLANRRSEIKMSKNKPKRSAINPFVAKKPVAKKAVIKKVPAAVVAKKSTVKPFKAAGGSSSISTGGTSISVLIADFQSKDETEQRRLIGAGVATLLVGGLSLGGAGGGGDTKPAPAPKPSPAPKPTKKKAAPAPAPAPVVEKIEEPVVPPPSPPPPAPPAPVPVPVSAPPKVTTERKFGNKESFASKLVEKPPTPSPAPAREVKPPPPALSMEPWYKKGMDQYLSENAAEGDVAANAPLIAAALLGLVATRSTMESSKEMREQQQDALDIVEAVENGDGNGDEAEVLIKQLEAKIEFFKDDDDLRASLETVKAGLVELQAKKKSLDS